MNNTIAQSRRTIQQRNMCLTVCSIKKEHNVHVNSGNDSSMCVRTTILATVITFDVHLYHLTLCEAGSSKIDFQELLMQEFLCTDVGVTYCQKLQAQSTCINQSGIA